MAETLRELVVSLSLQSDSFNRNVRSLKAQIREIESRFDDAGDGADGFETKLKNLGDKLTAQASIVDQYKQALNNANTALGSAVTKNDDLKKKLDAAKTAHSNLKTEVENATTAYKDAKKAYGENSEEANALGLVLLDLKEKEGEAAKGVKDLEGEVNTSNASLQTHADKVTNATTNLNNAEKAYEATKSDIAKTEDAIKNLSAELDDSKPKWEAAQEGLENFGKKAQAVGEKMSGVGKSMTMYISAPLAALGGFAYKSAADYERAFVGVRKTTEATEEEFDALHDGLLELSERAPVGYADLAGTMEISGQLGVEGVDNLLKFTEVMTALGVSTNLGAEQGAESLAKFANITGMSLGDIDRLGSVIVALGNNYATTEADIVSMATRMASSGDLAGLSETDILGLAAALSSVGIEAEAGGSAASKLMKQMQVAAETGDTAFADVMGLSADDFAKMWDEDAAQTILGFFESLSKLDEGGQTSAIKMLDDMGLTEIRLSNLILASTKNTEGFASALDMANTAWEENTALMAEAEQFYDTELSKAQTMANRAQNVAADFGDNITEMLKPLKEQLLGVLEWFNSFDEETQTKIITWFGVFAAAGPVVKVVGDTTKAVGNISSGIGKLMDLKPQILNFFTGPAGWATLAVAGVAALGIAIASIKSDMEIVTSRAAAIELKIDEGSKNETIQAIAEVRKEIEGLSGGETSERGAGVIATVKAGYGTSEMYGQALAHASSEASAKITAAGADYQAQIDNLNAQIVAAVEAGDQAAADELAKQRDQTYSAWDAEVLALKEAHTQSISELVDGMAAQYPEAKAEIADAMEQYSAFKALNEFFDGANDRTEEESRALAEQILGMEGLDAALAEMGYGGMTAAQIFDTTPFVSLALGLRDEMAKSMTDTLEGTADSPIYTVLAAMLSDAGVVEGLDFSALDGTLADGIALLDFKAAAAVAEEKGGDVGQYLTMGIGVGILSSADKTNADVIALRDIVIAQVKEAFGIESPSRVMAELGKQLPAGLAVGIRRGVNFVQSAIGELFGGASDKAEKDADGWIDRLIDTWTDGKKETDEIVRQYVDEFKAGTEKIREAIEERKAAQAEAGLADDPGMEDDLEKLQALDDEIEALLKKRQNGFLTEDEKKRLEEVMQERAEIEIKYVTGDGTETTPAGAMNDALSGADFSSGATDAMTNLKTALDTAITDQKFGGVGSSIVAGIVKGVEDDTYKLKAAMIKMARDAVAAAKKELVIESPSRVLRDEVGVMMARGIGEGVLAGSKEQQRIIANAARQMADAGVGGVRVDHRRTYNQQSTVSLAGANLYVRDDQDIYALATEIAALTKRQQRASGARMA